MSLDVGDYVVLAGGVVGAGVVRLVFFVGGGGGRGEVVELV